MSAKPTVAVHKFSSCDGCQLAFINLGEPLLELAELVDIVHFAEAGPLDPDAEVDVAFVEGSVATPEDLERIEAVRRQSRFLITIGACATSGGLQALRNMADAGAWFADIYPEAQDLESLDTSTPISAHVKVDMELWGCPVSGRQVLAATRDLLFGVKPRQEFEPVCMQCKRSGAVCVLVTWDVPCMGPVTRTGCGALCPRFGRDCYACYGPAEQVNDASLARRFAGFGLTSAEIAQRFSFINSGAPAYQQAAARLGSDGDD